MEIREIQVGDEADFAAWFGVRDAVERHDVPDQPRWLHREQRVRHEDSDYRTNVLWLAEADGEAVGAASLALSQRDNLNTGMVDVAVLPEVRRRGIGTALLRRTEKHAEAAGRSSLIAFISGRLGADYSPGTAFAERHGFTSRVSDVMRVLRAPFALDRIADVERAALAHAESFELMTWRGRVPDEYADDFARLVGRMSTDAPMGELDYEPEVWDVQRFRQSEQRVTAMGRQLWYTAAVAPNGSLAGMTELMLSVDRDEWAFQGDTIVDSAHRGHRLGLLMKIANLRAMLADRPAVTAVCTWNAGVNRHMVAINEQLGFVEHGWAAEFQR